MQDHAPADAVLPGTTATVLPPRAPGRFSPLSAPQRAAVDAFLAEARPWALRQAQRSYGHLPAVLHEQAIDQAGRALRTGAPSRLDRRSLYRQLTGQLTAALRDAHAGWCLNEAERAWGQAPPAAGGPAVHPVAGFVEDGLGGLERAVLQLEIGAGRDTASSRAALRLGPAQYRRYREQGLTKLRGAVAGMVRGRVCDHHLEAVTLAATGDRDAADRLGAGERRCRSCAREAGAVRQALTSRLAVAPWPLLIKPAGALTAKLGAIAAVTGGKGTAGGGLLNASSVSGTSAATGGALKTVAAVFAAAAVATAGAVAIEGGAQSPAPRPAPVAETTATEPATAAAKEPAATTGPRAERRARALARKRAERRAERRKPARTPAAAPQPTPTAAVPAPDTTTATGAVGQTVDQTVDTVEDAVKGVTRNVDEVSAKVPGIKTPDAVPDVQGSLDEAGGTAGGLLGP